MRAVDKSRGGIKIMNFLELNPWLMGEKRERYPLKLHKIYFNCPIDKSRFLSKTGHKTLTICPPIMLCTGFVDLFRTNRRPVQLNPHSKKIASLNKVA